MEVMSGLDLINMWLEMIERFAENTKCDLIERAD